MQDPSLTPASAGPIRIDVGAVVDARLGAGRVPRFVVKALERLIRQHQLNDLLAYAYPRRGAAFCKAVLDKLGITVNVVRPEAFTAVDPAKAMFVSNHPLGGLDGMALIEVVERLTGRQPYFVVNDLLMAVEPLGEVFVPVNKHGAQSRGALAAIDEALASDRPVIIFPAGLCSRRRGGHVADLEWKKMFVQKARQHGRTIVPLHFDAANSPRFYRAAWLREKLGVKFNIEMVLLPSEIFRNSGATFTVTPSAPIAPEALGTDARAEARRIRDIVYSLAPERCSNPT